MKQSYLALCIAALLPLSAVAADSAGRYGDTPLTFEPNQGQTDATVRFVGRGSGYEAFLNATSATLLLSREENAPLASRSVGRINARRETQTVLRMRLEGATPNAPMSGDSALPGYVNYLSGADPKAWQVGVPTFAAATVHEVYSGIDLKYYGSGRRMEYDFIVAPQAQPGSIRIAIDGALPVLESTGELRLRLGKTAQASDVVFHKPVVYQDIAGRRHFVDASFKVYGAHKVGFALGDYDHTRTLIIDPVISYASYFGGSSEDEMNGSALNAANQLYAVGQTHSSDLPGTTGTYQGTALSGKNNNYHSGFVTKFAADGTSVIWTTYLYGSQDDFAEAVAVNSSDQAYIVGYTNSCGAPSSSPSFPFTSDAVQAFCSPDSVGNNTEGNGVSYDAFLVKLSSDGKSLLYGTPLGGNRDDIAQGVALDATGKVYIVGETNSTSYEYAVSSNLSDWPSWPINQHGAAGIGASNYPTTANAFYQNTTVAKMYTSTDSNGNVTGPQYEQAFLTVLSADLHTMVYSTLIGGGIIGGCGNGACNTNGLAIAVNAGGIAFIGGNTSSAHWPTSTGAFLASCANAGSANSQCPMTGWLAAFDATKTGAASRVFSTYVNGTSAGTNGGTALYPGSDVFGLAVDSQGNVVATGDTNANNFPTTAGTLQPACVLSGDGNGDSNVCANAFVTKFSPTGATVWSTYYHGTAAFTAGSFVTGQGVALDSSDDVYVVGTSNVPSIPLLNAVATNSGSQDDVMLFELTPDAKTLLAGTFLGSAAGVTLDNNALHLDSARNAYFSGSQAPNTYGGTYFPITAGAFDATIQGSDGWVVKMQTNVLISTTTFTVTPNPVAPATSTTFTATVAGVSGAAVPTGTVSFQSGSTLLATATLNSTGTATVASTTLAAGTYSVVATYSGDSLYSGSASAATSLTVAVATPAPTVTLTAAPTSIALGATSTLTWSSTNATACTASGGWTGAEAVSGTKTETPTAIGTASFTLTCTGTGGNGMATATVTVAADKPTVTLTAAPTAITLGATSTLTWSSTNATACTASGGWTGAEAVSGTASETPTATGSSTYTLTCTGTGGSGTATATVTVAAAATTPTSTSHGGGGAVDLWTLGGLLALGASGVRRRQLTLRG